MDKQIQNLKDKNLLLLIQQGNETAIATLLDRYKSKFFTTLMVLVKDEYAAEDIFQDTCIKIITCIRQGKYLDDGRFMQWSMRITRNMAMDYLRDLKKMPKITFPDGKDVFATLDFKVEPIEHKISRDDEQKQVRQLLELLPYEQREVVVLRMFGNLSFKEIAEILDSNLNTVLGRMRYGINALKKYKHQITVLQ